MYGFGVLIILLFISSIPAIAVFIWFRLARYPFSLPRFSFSLLAGTVAFFPALFLQKVFSAESEILYTAGKWGLIAEIFVRIAFTEEFSRLIVLVILFSAIHRVNSARQRDPGSSVNVSADTMASASGLIAGLGFAILESAVYGASNPGNALLRTFTAAPLHGACGFRAGSSITMFSERPIQAIFRFLSAVVIHGIYNFMLIIPGFFPSIAAILIALSALATSIMAIRNGMKGENI
ncbi:MAG: PrsW family intramembrane metalloprotease [Treponema sp.]|jgi:RsiW-degrading membrane proteinase PrsW (M82 family)|nr:PrsW family intramembrane metalloprotease [Treponema sp.]